MTMSKSRSSGGVGLSTSTSTADLELDNVDAARLKMRSTVAANAFRAGRAGALGTGTKSKSGLEVGGVAVLGDDTAHSRFVHDV